MSRIAIAALPAICLRKIRITDLRINRVVFTQGLHPGLLKGHPFGILMAGKVRGLYPGVVNVLPFGILMVGLVREP